MRKYDRNYTDEGYLMNYKIPKLTASAKRRVLQFRIELIGVIPSIWRRIVIEPQSNFWDLHVAIQDAMGWQDYHLHHFEIKGRGKRRFAHIGIPDFEGFNTGTEVFPGWEISVEDHFNDLGVSAVYVYDYGDDWMHTVMLEGYLVKDRSIQYPICTAGERACPPEDCGGIPGYQDLIRALEDPGHEEHHRLREWVGEDWSPERFDPEDVRFDPPQERWFNAFLTR